MKSLLSLCVLLACVIASAAQTQPPATDSRLYAIGNPTLTDIWVDPVNGNDSNNGATRATAMKTVKAAWNRTPRGVTLTTTGYRILLVPGTYAAAGLPNYWELRYGTPQFPVILQAAEGRNTVTIAHYLNVFDCRYTYFIDLNVAPAPPTFNFHLERGDHVLLRGMKFDGQRMTSQTVKLNNSQHVYVEQCDIGNATGTPLDIVAVQYGHVIGNRIHDGGNWAMFVKGGSAYWLIEGNELFNAVRGGFSAGQYTGFEYLDAPWVHYEAYDIKFVNNVIHDTTGCGMAVEGGYDILLAHNTLYRTGSANALVEMLPGQRVCSSNTTACAQQNARGGWGTASTTDVHSLPNRNVFIYNNLIYNPAGVQSRWMHFLVYGPRTPLAGSNIAGPVVFDQNLQIMGNLVWNGPVNHPLGIEDRAQGCQPTNPTCNATQLVAANGINAIEPQLVNPTGGNYVPSEGSNVLRARTYAIPDFTWSDAPGWPGVPAGNLRNAVTRDFNNQPRGATSPPGAFVPATITPTLFIVSSASYQSSALAAGAIATAFGTKLATALRASSVVPLPTALAGTTVKVRDSAGLEQMASLFFASPTQVNFLLPPEMALGPATVTVTCGDGTISTGSINVVAVAPGLFSTNANGSGLAAALLLRVRADGSQRYEPVARFDISQNAYVSIPLEVSVPNETVYLVLFGTGLRARSALAGISMSLSGTPLTTLYAGPSSGLVGVDQVNIGLPPTLAGRGELSVSLIVDGRAANEVQVRVK
jgi:uncharacterized protein (TIGR03437 family)